MIPPDHHNRDVYARLDRPEVSDSVPPVTVFLGTEFPLLLYGASPASYGCVQMSEQSDDDTMSVSEPLRRALGERYLTYALSTIMHRALPDARDGLKPVHRRILYAMRELRLSSNGGFRKSAKISGDVMGNYHPHGESIRCKKGAH